MRGFVLSIYLFFSSTFLLFSTLELFPDLLHLIKLERVPYYFAKSQLVQDPYLIFTPRFRQKTVALHDFRGDMYSATYGVDVLPMEYRASYDVNGFRTNSSTPPIDILVIGDSFIEIGESDESTFSEILKRVSKLSTLNLGRSWYGPSQYLELFKSYGLTTKAKYALLCLDRKSVV